MAAVLQKVALLQAVPDLQLDEAEDIDTYRRLATALTQEDTQLFYQIAIVGRRDLELAPDARAGFEMVLLRMLAFGVAEAGTAVRTAQPPAATRPPAAPKLASAAVAIPAVPAVPVKQPEAVTSAVTPVAAADIGPQDWPGIVAALGLVGPATQLAAHTELIAKHGDRIQLALDSAGEPFRRPALEEKLAQALSARFGADIKLDISMAAAPDTPARRQKLAAEDRLQNARVAIEADPNIRAMRDMFGATVQPDSVRPVD
jgi:DNA polymerase-3 subunit gamma/tau